MVALFVCLSGRIQFDWGDNGDVVRLFGRKKEDNGGEDVHTQFYWGNNGGVVRLFRSFICYVFLFSSVAIRQINGKGFLKLVKTDVGIIRGMVVKAMAATQEGMFRQPPMNPLPPPPPLPSPPPPHQDILHVCKLMYNYIYINTYIYKYICIYIYIYIYKCIYVNISVNK
jgi:hypothetical protein